MSKASHSKAFEVEPKRRELITKDNVGGILNSPISVTLSRHFGQNVLVIVVPETQGVISSVESEGEII